MIIKKITTLLFTLSFIISVLPLVVSDNSISNNNIIYVDDDGGGDYFRIQDAIDNASDGDTVYVFSGTYCENLIINKKIKLIGENQFFTYIDGCNKKDVLFVIADGVTISDFMIYNSGKSGWDSGIQLHSNNSIITDNIIVNNTVGVFSRDSNNNTIIDNAIFENKDYGIYLHTSINNLISSNVIFYNRWGIYLYHSSNYNIVKGNTICVNRHRGIWSSWCYSNKIFGNTIDMNLDYGIFLSGSYNEVSDNIISNSTDGLYLAMCNDNIVSKNNFFGNGCDASFMSGSNIWRRNYWNRIRFFPKLIFDKASSLFPKIDVDWFPAKRPYEIESNNLISEYSRLLNLDDELDEQFVSDLPAHFDWRDVDGVDFTTHVKNQVPAPTCEAYALVGSLETLMQYQIGYPYDPDLSETHLYFYAGGTYRGGGVLLEDAAEYLIDYGVPDEGCFPDPHRAYDYPFESLPDWESRVVKIQEWGWIENDVEAIKSALIEYGPLIICIVQRADFLSYHGGIYFPMRGLDIVNGHVITIVGYDEPERYWIVRNSGGTGWGEEGYARVSFDADNKYHPIIWPFYGGTGIMYIDGLYGNLKPDVPKIQIEGFTRHHTYIFGLEFPTRFKDLDFVEKTVARVIGWTDVKVNVSNALGVKFYLDGMLEFVDEDPPFSWRFTPSFGSHTIDTIAYNEKHLSKDIVDIFSLNRL